MATKEEKSSQQDIDTAKDFMVAGAAGQAVNQNVEYLHDKYYKPDKYDRHLYDSGAAKRRAKQDVFANGAEVKDPYTGQKLELRKQEAKAKYGEDWQNHLAESDHIDPIKKVHDRHKGDAWNTSEDVKAAANSSDNMEVTSRKYNNAKRDKTNEEFVDSGIPEDKGIEISEENKAKAREHGKKARRSVDKKLNQSAAKNVVKEFHNTGTKVAVDAGKMALAMSAIDNIVQVIKGEKDYKDALVDIGKDTGKAAAIGYVTGGGMSVLAHTLASSSSEFLKSLAASGVPGKVLAAVMMTGQTLKKLATGEISLGECITELGETGLGCSAAFAGATIGQTLIPIPILGAAIGSMVGTVLWGTCSRILHGASERVRIAKENYEQIHAQTELAIARMNEERIAFEKISQRLFQERADAINKGFEMITQSALENDYDMMVSGLDKISASFGKQLQYKTFGEFDAFMSDDDSAFEF